MKLILPLSVLCLLSIHVGMDYMLIQWFAAFVMAVIFAGCKIKKVIPTITFIYFGLVAVMLFALKSNGYHVIPHLQLRLQAASAYSALAMLCVFLPIKSSQFPKAIAWFGILNSAYVIVGYLFGFGRFPQGVGYSGFLDYAGMNGVLICFSIPFLIKAATENQYYWLGIASCLLAIGLSKSSIPIGVLFVEVLAFCLHKLRQIEEKFSPIEKACGILLAVLPIALVGFIFNGASIFNSAGRFTAYKMFMTKWYERSSIWFGAGAGSFQVFAATIQRENGFQMGATEADISWIWLWLHSDWLQIVFEYGAIGFVLAAALYGEVLFKLWKSASPEWFALAIGVGASAIFDFPLRYCATAFFVILILRYVYTEGEACEKKTLSYPGYAAGK